MSDSVAGPRPGAQSDGLAGSARKPSGRRVRPNETCRMFESDFFEWFSRIHPITPFVAWVPVVLFVLYRSVARHDLAWWGILGVLILGVLAWTLTEYVLHRYIFHWIKDTP